MDRQKILETLFQRQSLRREARLPLLDLKGEYHRAVAIARWSEIVSEHWAEVEEEILRERRATKPDWGVSAGGRMALRLLTAQALRARFAG